MISEQYRELNRELHKDPDYGYDGGRWAQYIYNTCKEHDFHTLLDYGCGKGRLKRELAKLTPFINVSEYDPAIKGKDQTSDPVEVVFCGDVLEHIEPDYIDEVLKDIARCATRLAVLYIATNEAMKFLADGRNAHLIQENMHWWFNKVSQHMEVTNCHAYKAKRILMTAQPLGSNLT